MILTRKQREKIVVGIYLLIVGLLGFIVDGFLGAIVFVGSIILAGACTFGIVEWIYKGK